MSHEEDNRKRRSTKASPRNASLQDPTKATLWIESRKTKKSPKSRSQTPTVLHAPNTRRTIATIKKSTPLRLTVLRKAQSAQKMRVMKIEAPTKIGKLLHSFVLSENSHCPDWSRLYLYTTYSRCVHTRSDLTYHPCSGMNYPPRSLSLTTCLLYKEVWEEFSVLDSGLLECYWNSELYEQWWLLR